MNEKENIFSPEIKSVNISTATVSLTVPQIRHYDFINMGLTCEEVEEKIKTWGGVKEIAAMEYDDVWKTKFVDIEFKTYSYKFVTPWGAFLFNTDGLDVDTDRIMMACAIKLFSDPLDLRQGRIYPASMGDKLYERGLEILKENIIEGIEWERKLIK